MAVQAEAVEPFFDGYGICEMVCIIPEMNRRRFYRIEVTPGLYGPVIVRAWGRIGNRVRVMVEPFEDLTVALDEANRLFFRKLKKSYKVVDALINAREAIHPHSIKGIRVSRSKLSEQPFLPGLGA